MKCTDVTATATAVTIANKMVILKNGTSFRNKIPGKVSKNHNRRFLSEEYFVYEDR